MLIVHETRGKVFLTNYIIIITPVSGVIQDRRKKQGDELRASAFPAITGAIKMIEPLL